MSTSTTSDHRPRRHAVRFHCTPSSSGLHLPTLRRLVSGVLRGEGQEGAVDVIFQDPDSQRALNLQWRSIDRTTDVLSFPYHEPDLLGELYIDLELAARQADRAGHDLQREVGRLVVHGVLHLCGHDHATPSQRHAMRRLEDRYDFSSRRTP